MERDLARRRQPFATTGVHAESVVGGYAEGFVGPGGECNEIVVGGTAGVSVGFGAGAGAGGSETVVISLWTMDCGSLWY